MTQYTKGIMSFLGWNQKDEGLYTHASFPDCEIQDHDTELCKPEQRSKDFSVYMFDQHRGVFQTFEEAIEYISEQLATQQ